MKSMEFVLYMWETDSRQVYYMSGADKRYEKIMQGRRINDGVVCTEDE